MKNVINFFLKILQAWWITKKVAANHRSRTVAVLGYLSNISGDYFVSMEYNKNHFEYEAEKKLFIVPGH